MFIINQVPINILKCLNVIVVDKLQDETYGIWQQKNFKLNFQRLEITMNEIEVAQNGYKIMFNINNVITYKIKKLDWKGGKIVHNFQSQKHIWTKSVKMCYKQKFHQFYLLKSSILGWTTNLKRNASHLIWKKDIWSKIIIIIIDCLQ
jgi:hypothetical protein